MKWTYRIWSLRVVTSTLRRMTIGNIKNITRIKHINKNINNVMRSIKVCMIRNRLPVLDIDATKFDKEKKTLLNIEINLF